MNTGILGFFRRFGASAAAPELRPVPVREVQPVRVTFMDEDETDEPTLGGGASVRHLRRDLAAEGDPPGGGRPLFAMQAAGKTDTGKRRRANEDALLVLRKYAVYVVADGMGGHAGGAVASVCRVACDDDRTNRAI